MVKILSTLTVINRGLRILKQKHLRLLYVYTLIHYLSTSTILKVKYLIDQKVHDLERLEQSPPNLTCLPMLLPA